MIIDHRLSLLGGSSHVHRVCGLVLTLVIWVDDLPPLKNPIEFTRVRTNPQKRWTWVVHHQVSIQTLVIIYIYMLIPGFPYHITNYYHIFHRLSFDHRWSLIIDHRWSLINNCLLLIRHEETRSTPRRHSSNDPRTSTPKPGPRRSVQQEPCALRWTRRANHDKPLEKHEKNQEKTSTHVFFLF